MQNAPRQIKSLPAITILEIVKANPGIDIHAIRQIIKERHPEMWNAHTPRFFSEKTSQLAQKHLLVNASPPCKPGIWYTPAQWASKKATRPGDCLGADTDAAHKPDPLAWLATPAKRTASSFAAYVPPTVTPARSDALAHSLCPSRDGDKLMPHTTPKAMCTGPGRGIYGPGRINARSVSV